MISAYRPRQNVVMRHFSAFEGANVTIRVDTDWYWRGEETVLFIGGPAARKGLYICGMWKYYTTGFQSIFSYRAGTKPKKPTYTVSQKSGDSIHCTCVHIITKNLILTDLKTKGRAIARKARDAAAVLFGLKYGDNTQYKFKSII